MSASAFTDEQDAPAESLSHPRVAVISQGFETLLAKVSKQLGGAHFDVVIVGSGYGGAIAAAELADCKDKNGKEISVCVLERGSEYLPGMFPSRLADLPKHVRFTTPSSSQARGQRMGLFDIRAGGDVNALVANGLGGGSLINAGVMEEPAHSVFRKPWPTELRTEDGRRPWYNAAKARLGAVVESNGEHVKNSVALRTQGAMAKATILEELASKHACGSEFRLAELATLLGDDVARRRGAPAKSCIGCGDCATGCNHGAKNSLDVNLVEQAHARGAEIFTGATVLRILRGGPNQPWSLEVVHTEARLRARQGAPLVLRAHKVILAAGTFGSTEILLRSSGPTFGFSPRLGRGFSTNGDTIAALYGHDGKANSVADENLAPDTRRVGPTIEGIVTANTRTQGRIVIEDIAIPGPLRPMFEEVISTANVLHTLDQPDSTTHSSTDPDPCAVDPDAISKTSIFAMMGNDGAAGAIELIGGDATTDGDGAVRVRWPDIRKHALFDEQLEVLKALATSAGINGRVLPNPIWRFVPKELEDLFGGQRGPAFTVHPLGGCGMGTKWSEGVVDQYGRVFRPRSEKPQPGEREPGPGEEPLWDGLVVLDGSIVPTALGTNPALTIAALALRAVDALRKVWEFTPQHKKFVPVRRLPAPERQHAPAHPNLFELVERVRGTVYLAAANGRAAPYVVELTLKFKSFSLAAIIGRRKRPLELDVEGSELRIVEPGKRKEKVRVPLRGTLTVFRRESSDYSERRCRGVRAWFGNRGARDTWQWLLLRIRKGPNPVATDASVQGAPEKPRFLHRIRDFVAVGRRKWVNAMALASHAGEVRLLEYDLVIGASRELQELGIAGLEPGAHIRGIKRFTYARRSNPWQQLQTIKLEQFPGIDPAGNRELELDLHFFEERNVPLLRIVEQRDQPAALADLFAFLSYLLRLMIVVHVWSFRKPETPDPREPQRLPGVLRKGLLFSSSPVITELDVDELPDGTPVRVRLTRYKPRKPKGPPVVLIHGYSASGTTFAHNAVRPNLTTHLLGHHRDVWVIDLRTSSGMPTARLPWTFEDAALVDIPAAIAHVVRTTQDEKGNTNGTDAEKVVDVIAHCMGSAMLSMAVLARPKAGEEFSVERAALPRWIRRAVLSQVGPIVEFSPANVLRGYVLGYVRQFLPLQRYEFRTGPDPSLTDQLIDRLLATLPYPKEEFDIENPRAWTFWRRTPWVGTRHRMDALYARDFNLVNIPPRVLRHIDDLFGPLNIETVSQGVHFARRRVITDRAGHNVYVSRRQLQERWKFPTLSVHGADNGLADVATLDAMQRGFREARVKDFYTRCFPGFGHQDSLIGRDAVRVFETMAQFLSPGEAKAWSCPGAETKPTSRIEPKIRVPWLGPHQGPIVARADGDYVPIRAAKHPGRERAEFPVVLPVTRVGDRFVLCQKNGEPDWTRVRAPEFTPDAARDDWIRIEQPLSTLEDANGFLVMLLDELPERLTRALPDLAHVRFRLRRRRVALPLAAMKREHLVGLNETMSGTLTDADKDRILTYLDTLRNAVLKMLEEMPFDKLLPALIEVPTPTKDLFFVFGSCQYAAGLLDAFVADRSMRLLATRLRDLRKEQTADESNKPRPSFLLLLGDQVYVDATAGLFDPTQVDDRFGRPYERLYEREAVQCVLRRLPSHNMLDDHEIEDNWEPSPQDPQPETQLRPARRSYWRYQRFDNFNSAAREFEPSLSFEFKHAGAPFFVLDTRTRRTARTAETVQEAKIVDDETFRKLTTWLDDQEENEPKFIACPSLPFPRHVRAMGRPATALRSDGWDGYPASLARLLGHIAMHEIKNVVFLSGDEHLSLIAEAVLQAEGNDPVTVHSIHSSAMYAPFPFANGDPADFADTDSFDFKAGHPHKVKCSCRVLRTRFALPGDGFAIVRKAAGSEKLICEFVSPDHGDDEYVIPLVRRRTAAR